MAKIGKQTGVEPIRVAKSIHNIEAAARALHDKADEVHRKAEEVRKEAAATHKRAEVARKRAQAKSQALREQRLSKRPR